jgi:cytochrome c553
MTDYLDILFTNDAVVIEANRAELARIAAVEAAEKAENAARVTANRLRPVCGRCHGAGRIGAFAHVAGGVCFECGGDGRK